jgi:simple sugar transport system substrate-binding protein
MEKVVLEAMPQAQRTSYELSRRKALGIAAKWGLGGAAAAALAGGSVREALAAGGLPQKDYKITFVNHVTTNPFFTPTQYGAQDACTLLGCDFQWVGSKDAIVAEMVNATRTAITSKADGIALAVVDEKAFREPVDAALDAGIPVVSYNADGSVKNPGTNRLAYIGQGLYESGYALGRRALEQVDSGDVAAFIATPGQLNIQPRIDGAQAAIKDSGKPINFTSVATNADITKGLSIVDAYVQGHSNVAGLLAVDAGSTQSVGQVVKKYDLRQKSLKVAGGFDLVPETLAAVQAGDLDYTIDQQPYLQGFLPVLALYFSKISGGLLFPCQTNTGLLFVTKDNVAPYLSSKSRYEGSDSAPRLVERTGPIAHA